jgi:hypothetical protein
MMQTPERCARAISVLGQIGLHPLSEDQPGLKKYDPVTVARNAVFPPGVTPEQLAADPDAFPHHG